MKLSTCTMWFFDFICFGNCFDSEGNLNNASLPYESVSLLEFIFFIGIIIMVIIVFYLMYRKDKFKDDNNEQ